MLCKTNNFSFPGRFDQLRRRMSLTKRKRNTVMQLYVLIHCHNMWSALILFDVKALQLHKHYRIPDGPCHVPTEIARTENWLEQEKQTVQ